MSAQANLVLVVSNACTACGACLWTCPEQALMPGPRRPIVIQSRCTACGECIEICPRGALYEAPALAGTR